MVQREWRSDCGRAAVMPFDLSSLLARVLEHRLQAARVGSKFIQASTKPEGIRVITPQRLEQLMKSGIGLDKCLTYLNCGIQPPALRQTRQTRFRSVTVSRQSGAGGHAVAELLAQRLQEREPSGGVPWTVFDRNLVEKVLEDHKLPARLARFMPEDKISDIADVMDELFGLHPPSWNMVRNVSETILRLIERGNVIIIGRGANVIGEKVESALHIRLIGSVERRTEHLRRMRNVTERAARALLKKEDRARARYLKTYFDKDIEDPSLYHCVINTDWVSHESAAEFILRLMLMDETNNRLGIEK
jgi:cytidylate kinase